MPMTGYDEDAIRIGGLRSGARTWRFKLVVMLIFLASIAVGAGLASLLR